MNEPDVPLPPLFANALMDAMIGAEYISASGLARRVWGTIKDKRGYDVPRNRDRIGQYLRGASYPRPENLQRIAKALGVPEAELASARQPLRRRRPISRKQASEPPMTLTGRNTIRFGFVR